MDAGKGKLSVLIAITLILPVKTNNLEFLIHSDFVEARTVVQYEGHICTGIAVKTVNRPVIDGMVYITIDDQDWFTAEMIEGQPQPSAGAEYFSLFLQEDIFFTLQFFFYLLLQVMGIDDYLGKIRLPDAADGQMQKRLVENGEQGLGPL